MDYTKFFSDDVPSFMRSPVREIFKKVDLSAIYSFAGGYPDASTFPLEDIRRLSAEVLDRYGAKALQYGATQGVTELRQAIATRYGVDVGRVQISTRVSTGSRDRETMMPPSSRMGARTPRRIMRSTMLWTL